MLLYKLFVLRYLFLILFSLFIVSCQDNAEPIGVESTELSASEIGNLVARSNTRFPPNHLTKSFAKRGEVEIFTALEETTQQPFARIAFSPNDNSNFVSFEIRLSEEVRLPEIIKTAEVVYLQDQILIVDQRTGGSYSFFVDGENRQDKFPAVQPNYSSMLKISVTQDKVGFNLKSASCTCDCYPCRGSFCSTISASCSCGGNGQSVTCNTEHNAQCSDCPDEQ